MKFAPPDAGRRSRNAGLNSSGNGRGPARSRFICGATLASILAAMAGCESFPGNSARPLALHPQNPHYFIFRGRPTVLITSGEHYGAVLNRDFDYVKYLDALRADGLNLTRTFTGAYVEPSGAFNIAQNTLAPKDGRFLCPWARSDQPGYAGGGQKFDLKKWDPEYFTRLKDFVAQASRRGIVVEMNLFCPFYDEAQWKLSPQNAANNINGLGAVARTNVYTLANNGGLLEAHDAMVRKIAAELRGFDNVYYEICNEPYFGRVTMEWQRHIADVIVDAEKSFSARHLVSQNIANGKAKIENAHPAVSIFNFHYATPPDTVGMNYGLGKVIGDNETGFKGTNDAHYRMEAWEFMLAGGGLYNNLDYSFTVGHEEGTFIYPARQPGGGSVALRKELRILKEFIGRFDFVKMAPDEKLRKELLRGLPEKARVQVLSEPGKQYAIYFKDIGAVEELSVGVPAGRYQVEIWNPLTGEVKRVGDKSESGALKLHLDRAAAETAVRIVK